MVAIFFNVSERFLQWFLYVFNVILVIVALVYIILGGWIFSLLTSYAVFDIQKIAAINGILLSSGLLLIIAVIIGYIGICGEYKRLVYAYSGMLGILMLPVLAVGCYAVLMGEDVRADLIGSMNKSLEDYTKRENIRE